MWVLALPFIGAAFLAVFGPLLAMCLQYGLWSGEALATLIGSAIWWVFLRALYVTFIKEERKP